MSISYSLIYFKETRFKKHLSRVIKLTLICRFHSSLRIRFHLIYVTYPFFLNLSKNYFIFVFSYTGEGKSNMALIDVTMVSGFEPIIREIEMRQEMTDTSYTQFEFIEGVLSFYFNEVSVLFVNIIHSDYNPFWLPCVVMW